ncbi:MAG: hypothetical protein CVT48_03325 [Thermoplasmata archaeon HGW-Thermoplasmata-1]|nr:MAG: hypothetical protein CVT48_03325 [Thermoplasmata archaeon HGW-Thermoplasmata-1]
MNLLKKEMAPYLAAGMLMALLFSIIPMFYRHLTAVTIFLSLLASFSSFAFAIFLAFRKPKNALLGSVGAALLIYSAIILLSGKFDLVSLMLGASHTITFGIFFLSGTIMAFAIEDGIERLQKRMPGGSGKQFAFLIVLLLLFMLILPFASIYVPALWYPATLSLGIFIVLVLAVSWILAWRGVLKKGGVRQIYTFLAMLIILSVTTESVPKMRNVAGTFSALALYFLIILTWIYAAFTTTKTTHRLLLSSRLGRSNPHSLSAIMMAAIFSIIADMELLLLVQGADASSILVTRMTIMISGVWLGFFIFYGTQLVKVARWLVRRYLLRKKDSKIDDDFVEKNLKC